MEHDGMCERYSVLREAAGNINASEAEKQLMYRFSEYLCFCFKRSQAGTEGKGEEMSASARNYKVNTAIALVLQDRVGQWNRDRLAEREAWMRDRYEARDGVSLGRVVWVDFQARGRITD